MESASTSTGNCDLMDTKEPEINVLSSGLVGSVNCSLHPLVIMNISEHWTRSLPLTTSKAPKVIGALLGKQRGRHIEIMNSYELLYRIVNEDILIDWDFYLVKAEQYVQIFIDLDFIGWYITGEDADSMDITIHKQFIYINKSPILLKLNPLHKDNDLPVTIYESVIESVNEETTMMFVPLTYTIAVEKAERIGIDHVATVLSAAGESSVVSDHLTAQYGAIKMLHSKVKEILDYIKEVQAGEVPKNHEILRQVYSLCHRLPALQAPSFRENFDDQTADIALMAFLSTLTKGCNDVHQFLNKFNVLYGKQKGTLRNMNRLFM